MSKRSDADDIPGQGINYRARQVSRNGGRPNVLTGLEREERGMKLPHRRQFLHVAGAASLIILTETPP